MQDIFGYIIIAIAILFSFSCSADENEGLFAGGRFIIWITEDQFEAEYIICGSGVPIIRSERGYLVPVKNP